MTKPFKDRLIEVLIEKGGLKEEDLSRALEIQRQKGRRSLKRVLVEEGFIPEGRLASILSQALDIPTIVLSKYKIDPELTSLIPERIARQYHLIPLSKIGDALMVATADPLNVFALDDLRTLTHCQIEPVISTEQQITEAIDRFYKGTHPAIPELIKEAMQEAEGLKIEEEKEEELDIEQTLQESRTPPIVKIVDVMLVEALNKRSSDIHLEPEQDALNIRYRIDGALHQIFSLPKKNQNAIIARLKIMSGLDITESRLPQDGRFKIRLGKEKEVDFRVSVLPTSFGEKVVLRALDRSALSVGLRNLGFLPECLSLFKEAIAKPFGMILVTGPTGSGKSTTLYSVINQLNTPDRNIVTIEDPVEYQIEGITQVQVKPDIGLTFADGLKSILRQSPDVILVGEIRDSVTADIAIKASLTGELVLSTLHTNDAAGAITRLIDMGVEPYLVASSLIMTCAQRLCRRICPYCKQPYRPPSNLLKEAGIKVEKNKTFFRGNGCKRCHNTGYLGRMGTLEVLMFDDAIREMVVKGSSSDEIKEYCLSKGMKTLKDNAIKKFLRGQTTLEEALRITTEQ